MPEPDISALLCSRICHDLISPVGAIGNGVELLTEIQPDAGDELRLIGQSAETASATLQFYRLAFGAATRGEAYPLAKCRRIVVNMHQRERTRIDWPEQSGDITRGGARLICNLMLIAASSLPRGGAVAVQADPGDPLVVQIDVTGPVVNFGDDARRWLQDGVGDGPPSAHDVHFLTAHRNLAFCGASLRFRCDEKALRMRVEIPRDG